MPVIVQWILGGMVWAITSSFGKLMASLGLVFVIQTFVLDDWLSVVSGFLGGVPPFAQQILGMMRVDDAITVILSAIAIKTGLKMISGLARTTAGSGAGL